MTMLAHICNTNKVVLGLYEDSTAPQAVKQSSVVVDIATARRIIEIKNSGFDAKLTANGDVTSVDVFDLEAELEIIRVTRQPLLDWADYEINKIYDSVGGSASNPVYLLALRQYRTALRDITKQDPRSVNWPVMPAPQ